MKKIALGLVLLALGINCASANQCPPVSALSHAKVGGHWKLNETYKNLGWYVSDYPYVDTSSLNSLKADAWTGVHVKSNEDGDTPNWFVTCEYDLVQDAFPRHVVVTNNELLKINPAKSPIPNFNPTDPSEKFVTDYICATRADNLAYCAW